MKIPARFLFLGAVLALGFPAATPVVAEDEKVAQIKALLEELRTLKAAATENKEKQNVDIIGKLITAAASERSATAFYVECVKMVNFDREERRGSEFRDWEDQKGIERQLKSDEHAMALQLQLRWLAISLRAATENDLEKLTETIYDYMGDYFKVESELGGYRRMLMQPVSETVFAKAYRLEDSLRLNSKKWELAPGRIDAVFDKTILPYYRAMDDLEELEKAWNARVSAVKNRAVANLETAEAKRQFTEVDFPKIEWKRDVDLYKVARTDTRLMGLVAHIKEHIEHAESGKWIDELMDVIQGVTGVDEAETEDA